MDQDNAFEMLKTTLAGLSWQLKLALLCIIPAYIFAIKVLYKKEVGLKKKVEKAKALGNYASAAVVPEDEYRVKRNLSDNSERRGQYASAHYTYRVNGNLYRKKIRSSMAFGEKSKIAKYITVYWLESPDKPFFEGSSDMLGTLYGIFATLFPWIFVVSLYMILTYAV